MSEFLYLNVLRISRGLIFVFSLLFPHFFCGFCPDILLHRNFSAPCPKFRFLLGFPRSIPLFPCGFFSESSSTPQFFRNSPFFSWLSFRRAAVPSAAYFLSCAAFSVVCCVILLPFFRCPAAFISASSLNRLYPSISPLTSAFPPPAAAVFSAFFPS